MAGGALERGVGRVAAQQPGAVGPADQLVALGQLASAVETVGRRRADELPEDPVGERQRHDHALAGDAAPALGEVPEERPQAGSTRVSCEIAWVVASRIERSPKRSSSTEVISG